MVSFTSVAVAALAVVGAAAQYNTTVTAAYTTYTTVCPVTSLSTYGSVTKTVVYTTTSTIVSCKGGCPVPMTTYTTVCPATTVVNGKTSVYTTTSVVVTPVATVPVVVVPAVTTPVAPVAPSTTKPAVAYTGAAAAIKPAGALLAVAAAALL